jgi:gliding motility-associated lipoprotein GldB
MKFYLRSTFFLLILSVFIISCNKNAEKPDVEDIKVSVNIERFDRQLMAVKSKEELQTLLKKNQTYIHSLYRTFPEDTAFVSHLYYLITHRETRALYEQTQVHFGELTDIKKEFESAFRYIKSYYPDFKEPKIVTTFTGLENDIFVSDTLVIIALEAFVGPTAKYRPQQPDYLLERYQKPYLVPTIIRFLSNGFIKMNDSDRSLLADMVFFGKAFEFTKAAMPETPDYLIIGYTEAKMKEVWDAQDLVWAHFVDKKLLFEQNFRIKKKYVDERPNVPEVGPDCPGRIGQWLGWRIVSRYRTENPSVTLQELMKDNDAQKIFKDSKYRGQIEE